MVRRVRPSAAAHSAIDGPDEPCRGHTNPERFSEDRLYNVMARLVRATRIIADVWTGGPNQPGHDEGSRAHRRWYETVRSARHRMVTPAPYRNYTRTMKPAAVQPFR
jgi:hypothetical protein